MPLYRLRLRLTLGALDAEAVEEEGFSFFKVTPTASPSGAASCLVFKILANEALPPHVAGAAIMGVSAVSLASLEDYIVRLFVFVFVVK